MKAFGQQLSLADSILKSVEKEKSYSNKIETLQKNIKLNSTKHNEIMVLARYGYKLAEEQNDAVNKGDFLRNIAFSFINKGSMDSGSVYYYKALNILKTTNDTEKLGLLYDDMARMYRKLEQSDRALSFYDKALALYEAKNDLEGIARINNESGVVFREMGDYKTANERFQKSLRIQRQRNDSVGIGYALEFIGANQALLKDYKTAENYLQEALSIRLKTKDSFAIILNYTALGELYSQSGRHALSNEYYLKSNELAEKISFADVMRYNYSQIAANHETMGNFKGAYLNLKAYNVLNDSLFNIQILKNIEETSVKYETAEKEKRILEQRTKIAEGELKLQKTKFYIGGLILLVAFIILFVYLFVSRQRLKHQQFKKETELNETLHKFEAAKKLEEQRLRISRDLHDNIGSQLTFVVSVIDNLGFELANGHNRIKNKLSVIKNFTSEAISELRDTIWAMNLSAITIEDLQARIANFIEKAKYSQHTTTFSFFIDKNMPADMKFTTLQGLNIYRIIQEATNNALKYSKAGQIQINIKKEKGIHFIISDDGAGFIEQETEPGNGLLNMRKRALELGSELLLSSAPGKGTNIEFCVAVSETATNLSAPVNT